MSSDKPLEKLRQEIDRIDDALHDLLMERTEVVARVGALSERDLGALLRPGREAEILRRLISRHQGAFPKTSMVRVWREIMGGMIGLQGAFSVAVFMPDRGAGYLELARDHYGSTVSITALRSPGQVTRAVAEGSAIVGIMPMPDIEDAEAWWISLMGDSPDLPRIIAKLPFADAGPGRNEGLQALAISRLTPEATGYDRCWLAMETMPDISRGRLRSVLSAAGIEPTLLAATQRTEDNWLHLVEVSGHLASDDRRIGRLLERGQPVIRAVVLGGYPVPLGPEDLID